MKPYPSIRRSGRGTHSCKGASFGSLNISASRQCASGFDEDSPITSHASYLLVWAWVPRGDVPAEEVSHEPSDQVPFAFQREVAGVEQVELYRLEVSLVRLG